jgi:molecular chaperone DnaK
VTPLSMGIETEGGIFTKLVERNTTIPTERKQVFSTAADNQTAVTVSVYQGERPMARDNRLLSQFNLEGIPPAPRGMPQVEVKFDIDANGIVSVSAKDLGTGKEQTVRIENASSLPKDEVDKLRREAEEHAAEDKKRRELAELQNQADSMCFQLEKLMKENKDKLSGADSAALEAAIKKTRDVSKSSDADAIKSALSELEQASHAVSKAMYEAASRAGAGAAGAGPAPEPASASAGGKKDDEAIDAEFEVKE